MIILMKQSLITVARCHVKVYNCSLHMCSVKVNSLYCLCISLNKSHNIYFPSMHRRPSLKILHHGLIIHVNCLIYFEQAFIYVEGLLFKKYGTQARN